MKKKSIAKILTRRILIMLILTVIILLVGSFFTVSYIVYSRTVKHSDTLTGIYADISTYNAYNLSHKKIDEEFGNEIKRYGDYMCKWYGVDTSSIYVPNFKDGTAKIISNSYSKEYAKRHGKPHKPGDIVKTKYEQDEIDVWNGKKTFSHIIVKKGKDTELVTTYRLISNTKEKFFVSVATNFTGIVNDSLYIFSYIAIVIALLILGIYILSYRIIRKKVSEPAQRISDAMNSYVTGNDYSLTGKSSDSIEFSMISNSFNKMTKEINAYIENIEKLTNEKTKQEAEIDVASRIQQGFLPNKALASDDYYIQCMMQPAKNIGGDLYDYIELDEYRTLIVIADVSGKGISAAIFMAVTLILIREYAKMDLSPAEILEKTNNTLNEKNPAMLFVTSFIGIFDKRDKSFTYANAGHNIPYLIGKTVQNIKSNPGTILGLFPDEKYIENKIQLKYGETLFLYTDGVTEVINNSNEFYCEKRLENELKKFIGENTDNIISRIYKSLSDFSEEAEQFDDITMLTLTIKNTSELELDYDIKEFEKIKELILKLPLNRTQLLNLCLVAEERFINICEYAFPNGVPNGEKIIFKLSQSDVILLEFIDSGIQYNPIKNIKEQSNYNPDEQIGGLGMFIIDNIVDDIIYDYRDGKNILTILKKYEEEK